MLLLGVFAAVAMTLAAVGIYGVISYGVSQRTQEIGVRISLGANAGDVSRQIVGQGLKLALTGLGVGLAGSLVLTRALASLLFGVGTADLTTFGAVAVMVGLVAVAAAFIPARRASRVDPMVALRNE
jgi:putative ABC transport system permease protein